jgi:hypothetical protein
MTPSMEKAKVRRMNTTHVDAKNTDSNIDPEPLLRDFDTRLDLLRSELSQKLAMPEHDSVVKCLDAAFESIRLKQI